MKKSFMKHFDLFPLFLWLFGGFLIWYSLTQIFAGLSPYQVLFGIPLYKALLLSKATDDHAGNDGLMASDGGEGKDTSDNRKSGGD